MPTALVRRPGPLLAEGLVTHRSRVPVDTELALRQWDAYAAALDSAGWDVVEVEPADHCADAVFVEDALVVFDDVAVVTRPGAASRRAETHGVELSARALGLEIARIDAPATLDGGDVLKVGRTVYVGLGGRTNHAGISQLDRLLETHDWTVVSVPVSRVLHLKSAVTALPDGTVIGYPEHVDDPSAFPAFLPVEEPSGAHVVLLGGDHVLMAADAPRTATTFRRMGLDVTEVDVSEFEKLEGCVTCLSVRHRGSRSDRLGA